MLYVSVLIVFSFSCILFDLKRGAGNFTSKKTMKSILEIEPPEFYKHG